MWKWKRSEEAGQVEDVGEGSVLGYLRRDSRNDEGVVGLVDLSKSGKGT